MWKAGIFLISIILSSCYYYPTSKAYWEFYDYLKQPLKKQKDMCEAEFFVIALVDAKHLDYTNLGSFFHTVAKHPSDRGKERDLGHAWVYLQGYLNGKIVVLEGGHSGERGHLQAKYFDGLMNYNDWGEANPTLSQIKNPRYEPNPVKYLWTTQEDGFFQKGSGGHTPTFAAKIDLTEEQFLKILKFIKGSHYPYHRYALTGHQCSYFVAQVMALAGFNLDCEVTMSLPPMVYYGKRWIRLWQDPRYSVLKFASPDQIEKSLVRAVQKQQIEYALNWYLENAFK